MEQVKVNKSELMALVDQLRYSSWYHREFEADVIHRNTPGAEKCDEPDCLICQSERLVKIFDEVLDGFQMLPQIDSKAAQAMLFGQKGD